MSALQAIVLGIVQGLTEFLPVSSTAHLRIVPAFLGWEDPGSAFTAVCQLGTMAAVLLYFRQELWRIVVATLRSLPGARWHDPDLDARLGWYIVLGTIPIGIFGVIFSNQIESGARSLYVIGTALILFSFVMLRAEAVGRERAIAAGRPGAPPGQDVGARPLASITPRDGLFIGVAQAIALIPGVSRSGATISAGLFRGFRRTDAARYSFLLSVPAVVLSGLFELRKIGDGNGAGAVPTAIATLLAFVVGYASIAFLLRFLARHSIGVFCGYRIALGVIVLALAGAGVIS
jgi:undecaprenyl-diphosphatase